MFASTYSAPPRVPLEYLHVDAALLVVNKPSGLLSVPGRGADKADCLVQRVMADYPDALIVHRLDMETSGLIVLARDKASHRSLSMQFQARQVNKRYLAMVDGLMAADQGEIDLPLMTDWPNRPRQKVDFEIGKPSLTRYQVLERNAAAGVTRVALAPETGRSHQLRVHLMAQGHPILGDALYALPAVQARAERLLLHAECVGFTHPVENTRLVFECPAPF